MAIIFLVSKVKPTNIDNIIWKTFDGQNRWGTLKSSSSARCKTPGVNTGCGTHLSSAKSRLRTPISKGITRTPCKSLWKTGWWLILPIYVASSWPKWQTFHSNEGKKWFFLDLDLCCRLIWLWCHESVFWFLVLFPLF